MMNFKSSFLVEEDILFKTMYETFYYCELRRGELRGLIWNDIALVAKYLGHSKIYETLNTYSHMFKNKLNNIMNLIDTLNDKIDNKKKANYDINI